MRYANLGFEQNPEAYIFIFQSITRRTIPLGFLKNSLISGLLVCFTLSAWSADDRSPTILVMGDSLSAGYGIDIDQGWVNLLRQELEGGYPHKVVNASVSGEISRGGLNRLPRLLEEHEPEVVILELGGNDGLRGLPLTELLGNLAKMIERSQDAGAQVLVIGIQIPPNYGKRYSDQFRQVYPKLSEKYQIPLVDFMLEGVATDAELMQRDGIHPKAEAQPRILENIWPQLKPLLEP